MRADRGVAGRGRELHGLGQIAAGLLIFGVYLAVAHIPHFDLAAANARGHGLLQAEQWLGIDAELAANRWLAGQPVMAVLAAWEYALTYVVTTFAVLGWVWWRRPGDYPWARNTLRWTTLAAIACFAAWPTTPPRLLPGSGFSDLVAIHHPFLSWGSGAVSAGANQFAAMPSLHVGWAVWVTAVSLRVRAARLGNGLAVLHVVVTVAVVMATANHYLLDVVGGAMIAGLAVGAEQLRAGRASRDRGERVAAPDVRGTPPPAAPGRRLGRSRGW
jgi:diacylglycerol O-acyltransferase